MLYLMAAQHVPQAAFFAFGIEQHQGPAVFSPCLDLFPVLLHLCKAHDIFVLLSKKCEIAHKGFGILSAHTCGFIQSEVPLYASGRTHAPNYHVSAFLVSREALRLEELPAWVVFRVCRFLGFFFPRLFQRRSSLRSSAARLVLSVCLS